MMVVVQTTLFLANDAIESKLKMTARNRFNLIIFRQI